MSDRSTGVTRRGFLGGVGAAAAGIREVGAMTGSCPNGIDPTGTSGRKDAAVAGINDGPASPLFSPIPLQGNSSLADLEQAGLSQYLRTNVSHAPSGNCICWGIPFRIERIALVKDKALELRWPALEAAWLVLTHTTDMSSEHTEFELGRIRGITLRADSFHFGSAFHKTLGPLDSQSGILGTSSLCLLKG